ncbi:MAG: CARDB domain-containing protein [Halobacteriota archaeon]
MNTSEGWQAKTSADSNFFLLIEFMNISEGNVFAVNVTDGAQFNSTNHTVAPVDINNSGICGINLTLQGTPQQTDLSVTDLWPDPEAPVLHDIVNVTARIKNTGDETNSTAIFYDKKNISIFKFYWNVSNFHNHGIDTITQPGALEIRVHFVELGIQGDGYIKIYDTADNLIHNFSTTNSWNRTDFWTNWSVGEEIRIESQATDHLYFAIDKYEAVFANVSITLGSGQSSDFNAEWNASAWLNSIEDIASGNHSIRVEVDPENLINESREDNNNKSITVTVKPARIDIDLEVTNVSVDKTPLFDGDLVNVTAIIINNGVENATEITVVFTDGPGEGNTSGEVFNRTTISRLGPGSTTEISALWNASFGNHTITVIADPEGEVTEFDETNNQNGTSVCVTKSMDFAVTNVSLSYPDSNESCDPNNLFLGEQVTVNATMNIINLANRGGKFDLGLFFNDSLLNSRSVAFDAGNGTENAVFEWEVDTAGNHSITVCADYNNSITELNETNNSKSVEITVRKGLDFAVTNVTFNLSEPLLGDMVAINATIANFGVRAGTSLVEFYDNRSMNVYLFSIDAKFEEYLNFGTIPDDLKEIFKTEGFPLPENPTPRVTKEGDDKWVINDEGKIYIVNKEDGKLNIYMGITRGAHECDEPGMPCNDTITLPGVLGIRAHFGSAVVVHYIRIYNKTGQNFGEYTPSSPPDEWTDWVPGDTLRIEASMAGFSVDGYQARIATESISLNAAENQTVSVPWTAAPGWHNISARVDPYNDVPELNETNNSFSTRIFVNGTDLAVTGIEKFCVEQCYVGDVVNVTAEIANLGAVNASNFSVIFRDGLGKGNTSGVAFNETPITHLSAGNYTPVTVPWNITAARHRTITVSIPFDTCSRDRHWPRPDNDETNNMKHTHTTERVLAQAEVDFYVDNVSCYPGEVREGANVTINATIGNLRRYGGYTNVSFYVRETDFARVQRYHEIGTRDNVSVPGGNDTIITGITWTANAAGGDHEIKVVLDTHDENSKNNVNFTSLYIIPPDLAVNFTVDPQHPEVGEVVNISAQITNNETVQANSTVRFYMEKEVPVRLSGDANPWQTNHRGNISIPHSGPEDRPWRVHFSPILHPAVLSADVFAYDDGEKTIPLYVVGEPEPVNDSDICDKDVWTDWTYSNTIKITVMIAVDHAIHGTVTYDFPIKYQVLLDNYTVTLNESECRYYDITWSAPDESIYHANVVFEPDPSFPCSGTSYPTDPWQFRLIANVEEEVLDEVPQLKTTDLAVTDVNVSTEAAWVWDGDAVNVSILLTNFGDQNATNFSVNLTKITQAHVPEHVPEPDDEWLEPLGEPYSNYQSTLEWIDKIENRTDIIPANASWNTTWQWTATLNNEYIQFHQLWSYNDTDANMTRNVTRTWTELAHNYTFQVDVIPWNKYLERDYNWTHSTQGLKNNTKESATMVHVNVSRDFRPTNVSFVLNNVTRDPLKLVTGMNVSLNVSVNVTNRANQGGAVAVGYYLDGTELPGSPSNATFETGNGTSYAELEWHVDVAGAHDLTVVVDPRNDTIEFNETNNATIPIYVHARASDLAVTDIRFEPESPEVGEIVNVTAAVANLGDKNESDVTVWFVGDRKERIESPHDLPQYCEYNCTVRAPAGFDKMRIHFDKIQLRTHDHVYVYDANGEMIEHYHYEDPYSHVETTRWIDGDEAVVQLVRAGASGTWGFSIDYIYISIENTTSLDAGETKSISVHWHASQAGTHPITVIIDPEDEIIEYNESNNKLPRTMVVQGADLVVPRAWLTWTNGTCVGENDTVKHGDLLILNAEVANIGIRDAENFNVSFFDVHLEGITTEIGTETGLSLAPGESILLVKTWTASIGNHTFRAAADYEDELAETSEANNTRETEQIFVCGAELSGSISWLPAQPLDEDLVTLTANISNYGCVPAHNFTAILAYNADNEYYTENFYYDQGGEYMNNISWHWTWENRTFANANRVYVHVKELWCGGEPYEIYNGSGVLIASGTEPGWVDVPGDTVNLRYYVRQNSLISVKYHAGKLIRQELSLDVSETANLSLIQPVTSFNHSLTLFIDTENEVPENHEEDNVVSETMYVRPTRDFTVFHVTPDKTNLSDTDVINITAEVANVGFRNGTIRVRFVDYETEKRTYTYHYDNRISPPYAPEPEKPTPEGRIGICRPMTIIHRPGVDAIRIHFNEIIVEPGGSLGVCDKNGTVIWLIYAIDQNIKTPWIPGDTAYIYLFDARFTMGYYTTRHEFHSEVVTLNASETWNETKPIRASWTASTGDHTIIITADPEDEIGEISESNNERSIVLNVNVSRDPAIEALNYRVLNPAPGQNPQLPRDGDDVEITATVRNNGTENTSFVVDFWQNTTINSFAIESIPDIGIFYIPLPDYVAGASWVGLNGSCWMGATGDRIKVTTATILIRQWKTFYCIGGVFIRESLLCIGGVWTCDSNWYEQVDKIRYTKLLDRVNVSSLAPGESRNVTAVWHNISVSGDPTHFVTVIADPEDRIGEIDERRSDNERSEEIIMDYPDFSVPGFQSPSREDRNASVIIENAGTANESNVTVRFCKSSNVDYPVEVDYTGEDRDKGGSRTITKEGAAMMRVHFVLLDTRKEKWAELELKKDRTDYYPEQVYQEQKLVNNWSDWIEGDTIYMSYQSLHFEIDKYQWGDFTYKILDEINASERVNVPIPQQWNKYDKYDEPTWLNVTVDPGYLFSMDTGLEDDLNAGIVSARVKRPFETKGLPISDNASVEQEEEGCWNVTDNATGKNYIIKYEKETLRVYETGIVEQFENNNVKEGPMYVDLVAEDLRFVPPGPDADHLAVDVENFVISAIIRNNNETKGIAFPAPRDFNVSFEVRYLNGTIAFPADSKQYQDFRPDNVTLYAGEEEEIVFLEKFIFPFSEDEEQYTVSIIADSENDINEGKKGNHIYVGEENNATSKTVKVYPCSGYMGGDLYDVTPSDNRIYGDVVYSIGNSKYRSSEVHFSGLDIPGTANITVARLYLYWLTWKKHVTPAVDMAFNGEQVSGIEYHDDTLATAFKSRYGTFVYDVTEQVGGALDGGGNLEATASGIGSGVCLTGMLLLIVYEDESKPLIEYWINEGAVVMMAKNTDFSNGLEFEQCIVNASFEGDVNVTKVGKAELLTVLPSWKIEEGLIDTTIGDALMFNDGGVGTPRGTSYWEYETDCMALTLPHWVDVLGVNNNTYLKSHANLAQIQSKGNFMMVTNAVLKVKYLPDLTVTLDDVPASAHGGETHKIHATIRNIGEAKAENFDVKFTASDETPEVDSRTVDLLGGNNKTTVNFTWTTPKFEGGILAGPIQTKKVNISVVVDPEDRVEELDESNNDESKEISMTLVKPEFKLSPGGGGTGPGTGPGGGSETEIKAGAITGGSGEATIGASGDKAITGYLMKGTVPQSGAEGGGGGDDERGEFSWVGLLIRIAMLAAAGALIGVGYLHERRRHNNKNKNNKKK